MKNTKSEITLGNKETILILEKHEDPSFLYTKILGGIRYTVIIAKNEEDFLKELKGENGLTPVGREIALAIMNISDDSKSGEDFKGLKFYQEIKKEFENIKVLFTSSHNYKLFVDSMISAGKKKSPPINHMVAFYQKVLFNLEDFSKIIRNLIKME